MDIVKEGTHTYLLSVIEHKEILNKEILDNEISDNEDVGFEIKQNMTDCGLDYYLSVEYEVLKRNSLRMLVPVQLREKDGEKSLLFDITGRRSLKMQEKNEPLSQDKCKRILQSISDLIQEIDDYMLNLNYVELSPEYIYESADGTMQWIYSPKTYRENLQARIEAFFEWMLIQIDYEDDKAVRYIYKVYNKVRKLGFSKELLENYLCAEEKEEEYIKRNSYEEFFREDLAEERVKEPEREYFKEADQPSVQKINAKKPSYQKFIYISLLSILGIASIAAIVFESICIVSGITKGFTEILLRYCIGGILFIAAFVLAILKCFRELRRIRKAPETCLADYNKKNRENDNAEQYNSKNRSGMGYENRLEYRGRRNNYFEFRKRIFLSDASRYGNRHCFYHKKLSVLHWQCRRGKSVKNIRQNSKQRTCSDIRSFLRKRGRRIYSARFRFNKWNVDRRKKNKKRQPGKITRRSNGALCTKRI